MMQPQETKHTEATKEYYYDYTSMYSHRIGDDVAQWNKANHYVTRRRNAFIGPVSGALPCFVYVSRTVDFD